PAPTTLPLHAALPIWLFDRGFRALHRSYEASLDFALSARPLMMLVLFAIIGLNVYLYMAIPKGFFPIQDSGRLNGGLRADQSISDRKSTRLNSSHDQI